MMELALPVQGMHCGGCAANVQNALSGLAGVAQIEVDLAAQQARVVYDPSKVDLVDLRQAVEGAGYAIATEEVGLRVDGMNCPSCVMHVQGALEDMTGVISAEVDLKEGLARVTRVAGFASAGDMVTAVAEAGYEAAPIEGETPRQTPAAPGSSGLGWRIKRMARKG